MADQDDDTTTDPNTDPSTDPSTDPGTGRAGDAAAVTEVLTGEAATGESAGEPLPEAGADPAPAEEEPEEPVRSPFGAQFSSPEPTAVIARPRRRATRPAGSADPVTHDPAPPAAPAIPAFVSFVAPIESEPAPASRRRSRRPLAESPEAEDAGPPAEDDEQTPAPRSRRSRSRRRGTSGDGTEEAAPLDTAGETAGDIAGDTADLDLAEDADRDGTDRDDADRADADRDDADRDDADRDDADRDDAGAGSRRRRRGRRGRGRGRTDDAEDTGERATDEDDDEDDEDTEDEAGDGTGDDAGDEADAEGGSATRRRRRRRRRGGEAAEPVPDDDDRPERAGRNGRATSDDDVRGVTGSTRLEAKRQRRREGRDTGRRRAPILTEAEFLARREAVERRMVIRQRGERTQIAVLEDGVLVEHYVTQAQATSFAGNVYLGRVQNVLPSMEAAFIDIGKGRNAVLYAGEVNWDAAGLSGKQRSIEQALKSGDKVLVQVTKDPIGHKGARLTQQVNLPGRFLVYVPGGSMTGISRKLPDTERQRLKDILRTIVPEDAGVIIRTAAEGASEEELTRDVARLQAQWEVIQTKASSNSNAPALLYGEPDLAIRVIRDVFNEDFSELVVQGDDAWDTVEAYVAHVSPELSGRLTRHTGEGDAFGDLRIDEQLAKALDRKVWLPSGGSLVIDRTEAMTVVDVNTGKFTGSGGNLESTVTRNNMEAAEEIVRQLRLRDIGGIIVIDFIDMVLESNRDLVLRRLTECLGRDRTKHQVAEVTSLGLVQMTRKRVGQGLLEVFSEPCEHCRGRGVLVHTDPVDEKRRGGSGGGSGGGSASGDSGGSGGRRDQGRREDRTERKDTERKDAERKDAERKDAERRDAERDRTEVATVEQPGPDAAAGATDGQPAAEGPRSGGGRRNRGRRNRGQSGEERAAEDAAVLAAVSTGGDDTAHDTADDTAEDPTPADVPVETPLAEDTVDEDTVPEDTVPEDAVAEDAVAEDAVAEDAVAEDTVPATGTDAHDVDIEVPVHVGAGVPAAEVDDSLVGGQPASEVPAAEPTAEDQELPPGAGVDDPGPADEGPAVDGVADEVPAEGGVHGGNGAGAVAGVVRPRRRRAASRPAGPPAS